MVRAYVLVKADVGAAADLLDSVRAIEDVAAAHVITGDWDLIIEIETSEVYDALATTATRVQGLGDVLDTKTYVSLDE